MTAALYRRIDAVRALPVSRLDARLSSREIHQALTEAELDPFLVVSWFDMTGPVFPPHPHAGFTVATYILPDSPDGFVNRDSLGTHNLIHPGGLHATVAGAGVLHDERPIGRGAVARGFQIWIDHQNGSRAVPPQPVTLEAAAVPLRQGDGLTVRVLVGHSEGQRSPVVLPTPIRLLDVTLAPHAVWTEALDASERGFLVMMAGGAEVGGDLLASEQVAVLGAAGEQLVVAAGAAGARLLLFAGIPLAQPRVFGGPVVGGSREEVEAFLQAARRGAFGTLGNR